MIDYERLKDIDIEDFIFLIYYFIITLSIYANKIEREYLITKNKNTKDKYRILLFIIFSIAVIIYIYYTISVIKELKKDLSLKARKLNELSLLSSILIVISGLITLYIIYQDESIEVELAFE